MPDPILPSPDLHGPSGEAESALAAQRIDAELDALGDADLEPIVLEIQSVVATVLGANRGIQAHLPEFATLPGFDVDAIRKLGDYARALHYWSAGAKTSVTPKPELGPLVERAIELRERYLHDLGAMQRHGVLPKEAIANLGGSIAHRNVASDLTSISKLVHERWSSLEGKTFITLAAMDELAKLGDTIMDLVGEREFAEAQLARDVSRRNRAYTLVLRTYGEAREGLRFIRRAQGDADTIAPSLYAGRRGTPGGKEAPVGAVAATAAASDALGPKTSSTIVPDTAGV